MGDLDWRGAERYLFVSPHPDDVELGCGGTLAQLVRRGAFATLAVVTDGRLGTRDPLRTPDEVARIRLREQKAAARELGAELTMLGLPDGGPHDYYRLRDRAVALIRAVRPDWVFVCDPYQPYELHSDHRIVGLAVGEAALLAGLPHYAAGSGAPHDPKGVLFYFPRAETDLSPLDAEALGARERAIACHRSQFREDDPYLLRTAAQLRRLGEAAGAPAAEPLHLRMRGAALPGSHRRARVTAQEVRGGG